MIKVASFQIHFANDPPVGWFPETYTLAREGGWEFECTSDLDAFKHDEIQLVGEALTGEAPTEILTNTEVSERLQREHREMIKRGCEILKRQDEARWLERQALKQ